MDINTHQIRKDFKNGEITYSGDVSRTAKLNDS